MKNLKDTLGLAVNPPDKWPDSTSFQQPLTLVQN